jgi:hypothetical protein
LSQSRERCWDCWRESIKLQPNTEVQLEPRL